MKAKYTKRQILESIKHWKKVLESMDNASLQHIKSIVADMAASSSSNDEADVIVDNYMDLIDIAVNGRPYESAKAMVQLGARLNDENDTNQANAVMSMVVDALRRK